MGENLTEADVRPSVCWSGSWFLILSLGLCSGCGGDDERNVDGSGGATSETGGSGGEAGQGSGGEAGGGSGGEAGDGSGGTGGGSEPRATCDSAAVAATSTCLDDQSCAVVLDYEVTCDDDLFGKLGFQVAATSQRMYMGATRYDDTRLWILDEDGVSEPDGFPLVLDTSPLAFAVDGDDTLYAVGDESHWLSPGELPGGLTLVTLKDGAFHEETVFDLPDRYVGFYDLDVAPDGTAHVWYDSDPPDEQSMATRSAGGEWSYEVVERPGSDFARFTLTDDGHPVAFRIRTTTGSHQLIARVDGQNTDLGSPMLASTGWFYRPIDPTVPTTDDREPVRFAALLQDPDGLRVAWVMGDEHYETPLEDTAAIVYECPTGWEEDNEPEPPCLDPCREQAVGLSTQSYAAALGHHDVWVAYLIQHTDWDMEYAPQSMDGLNVCVGNVTEDRSHGDLVVIRVPLDGQPAVEVLRTEIGNIGRVNPDFETDRGPVVIHAFADRVAVAARSNTSTTTTLRALLFEAP